MEESKETNVHNPPVEESASGSKDLSKTLPEEAFNNFLQGKRHILVQDYHSAVQSLSTACELYTNHFGEMALECAELHFLYGKALFRLSQQQSGVLGGALNTEIEDDDDDDEEEDGKSSEDGSKENEESEKNDSEGESGEKAEGGSGSEKGEEKEPSESTDSPQPAVLPDEPVAKETAEEGGADTSLQTDGNATQENAEAEEDDLELAWNSLETAKSIFLRQGPDDVGAQLKVADILQLLAEISMESDNNVAAIADLQECLAIKKRHLQPDDRVLAETYYQMGLAQMLEKMYLDALDNFRQTASILGLRADNLRAQQATLSDTPGSFERADCAKEVEELEGVLADVSEKIEDTRELIEDARKGVEERIQAKVAEARMQAGGESEFTSGAGPSSSKPVSNITHLLKRKKPEDREEEEDKERKRSKLSPAVPNGDAQNVAD